MPTDTLLFQLTLVLALAVVSHFVVRRFKQPLIIGEIIVGILTALFTPPLLKMVLVGIKDEGKECRDPSWQPSRMK